MKAAPEPLPELALANLPPPPTEPAELAAWAQRLVALSTERGREAGLREGEAKGRAIDVLLVLRARGLMVPPALEQQILACADAAVLAAWLKRAATAGSAVEAVAGAGSSAPTCH